MQYCTFEIGELQLLYKKELKGSKRDKLGNSSDQQRDSKIIITIPLLLVP
jgi:hypothetical protein